MISPRPSARRPSASGGLGSRAPGDPEKLEETPMIGTVTKIPPVVFLLAAAVAVLFAFGDAQSLNGLWFVVTGALLLLQREKERR